MTCVQPSPLIRHLLAQAATALQRQQIEIAQRFLREAHAVEPDSADVQLLSGIACMMRGDSPAAIQHLRAALQQRPDDAVIQMRLGCALHDAGAADEALMHLRRACELAPGLAAAWYNLGKALKDGGKLADAHHALQRALSLDEKHALARVGSADIHAIKGDIVQAVAEYRKVLRQHPEQAEAWHGLANLKTERLSPDDVEKIRQALQKPDLNPDARVALGFSLYRALEDQSDYAGAFEALQEANATKRRMVDWDGAAERAHLLAVEEAFAAPLPAPLDPQLGHEVIFVVSLPRSGSTLVEHILATHPQVEGANEIPDLPQVIEDESRRRGMPFPQWVRRATAEDWHRLGEDYLTRTARWRQKRPVFTDKGLLNWPLVGAALTMLPGAHVINCRRDPLETCFACYRQLFRHGMHFSYELNEMADHYLAYQRMSKFWQASYPTQYLDFYYEALLRDPKSQIRRLLAFCDLSFDPACLSPHKTQREVFSTASAAQVREPLRGEPARSTPYRSLLVLLMERLRA